MSKAIPIKNGIVHLAESRAVCPHCERKIPFDEIEDKYYKSKEICIRMKCKCKRYIGITQNIRGDYVAYELVRGQNKILNQ